VATEWKCLVTGGAGFIGSHLVDYLVKLNAKVTVLDDLSSGRLQNLKDARKRITFVKGSVCNAHLARRLCEGKTHVFHLAAIPSVVRSVEAPGATHFVNVEGTFNLLIACKEAQVARFVFSSSSSVYGDCRQLPIRETCVTSPLSPYAASKLAAELDCRVFCNCYGLSTICLRFFNVFGPRQDPDSQYSAVIPKFIKALKAGERPVIFGDGEQSRDLSRRLFWQRGHLKPRRVRSLMSLTADALPSAGFLRCCKAL
jgi:UDP-glucose 4-epimerase